MILSVTNGLGPGLFRLGAARIGLCSHLPVPGRLLGLRCPPLFRPIGVLGVPHGFASRPGAFVILGPRGVILVSFPYFRRQIPKLQFGRARAAF